MDEQVAEGIEGSGEAIPPAADPAIEAEARRGGWRPRTEWRGAAEDWIDAKAFVDNGKRILPHVQRHSAQLEEKNRVLQAQIDAQKRELEEFRGQVNGLTQFRADMDRQQRERIREEVWAEVKAAREANDFERERKAMDRLQAPAAPQERPAQASAQGTGATTSASPGPAPAPARTQLPQEMVDWSAANPWFGQDPVITQAMNVIGAEMRASGKFTGMSLTEQLNATAKVVQQRYMPQPMQSGNRVEGGSGSREGGGPRPTGDGWEALPAHVRQECDAQGERLGLIGDKKTFKTKDEWRKHFVREYNRYNPGVGYDFRPPGN